MKLFWENGYEGTSFADLISKMSMSPSSFYNAFGSKERLYREATESFMDDAQKWIQGALSEEGATTREAFTQLLASVAIEFTREDLPRGCMISLSGTHQGPDLAPIRDMMTEYGAASEVYLAARIRKAFGMAICLAISTSTRSPPSSAEIQTETLRSFRGKRGLGSERRAIGRGA
jgi:AcrR family transcriptional regulator